MTRRKYILIISSTLAFPVTFIIFSIFPEKLSSMIVYIMGMGVYWMYISSFIILLLKDDFRAFRKVIKNEFPSSLWIKTIPFLPVLGVLFISFLPNIRHIAIDRFLIVVFIAMISGSLEEIYWRGLYLMEFPKSTIFGFLIPSVLFGMWHISLWFLKGIVYHGGFGALVGGAFIMGILWSWSSRKLRQIRFGIYAHIIVNIFAFTGLFVDNGF